MLEPLGKSQVLSYLKNLSKEYNVYLISFEKKGGYYDHQMMQKTRLEIEQNSISWTPLCYHKKLKILSTTYDVLHGFIKAKFLIKKNKITLVHSRSYVATSISYLLKKAYGVKYIFDIRGFWVDEKVETGSLQSSSKIYHYLKKIEKHLFLNADAIVVLTKSSLATIKDIDADISKLKIFVIPTCVDLSKFQLPNLGEFQKKDNKYVVGYIGSIGGMYDFNKVAEIFCNIQLIQSNVEFIVISKSSHKDIQKIINNSKCSINKFKALSLEHDEVPSHVQDMDLGVYIYNRPRSGSGCAPTRLAEFLSCGVPVAVNPGIGDQDEIIFNDGNPVGISMNSFQDIESAVMLSKSKNISQNCRKVAEKTFSLHDGVFQYSKIYNSLL